MTFDVSDCRTYNGTPIAPHSISTGLDALPAKDSTTAESMAKPNGEGRDAFAESMFPQMLDTRAGPLVGQDGAPGESASRTIGDMLGMSPSPKCTARHPNLFNAVVHRNGSSHALPVSAVELAPNLVPIVRKRGRPRKIPNLPAATCATYATATMPTPNKSSSSAPGMEQASNHIMDVQFAGHKRKASVAAELPPKKPKMTPSERSKLIIEGKRKAKERRALAVRQFDSEAPAKCDAPIKGVGVFSDSLALRRTRGRRMLNSHESVNCNGQANLLEWDALTATSKHTSSSSRAAPFPFVPPPVLNSENKPNELNVLKDYEVKLIGRREPASQPFPDLLYDITQVLIASEDSILFRTKSRETWTALVPEMSMLSSEAGWRNRHLLAKHERHTYDSKPLRMDYIYDRITCDDPVDGWQIRCRHTGQLQGFLTYTFFITYQPLIFRGDPPDLVRKLNRCHRQNSYWYGCVWPEVVELVLLGALACGTVLMEEFLDSLVNTDVKFVLIHATVHARGYYEKLGFQRVKASARYDVKNRELRTPTVTSAGYDGGYGFHMLLLQFMNDFLANLPLSPVLRAIAAQADRGQISSIHQAWKALEAHIPHGNKMESKKLFDYYRNQYRVYEEFHIDVTSPGYINAFTRDPACFPYHHWQFKSVTSSELEDPSLLLVLELSSWPGRKSTSRVCTVPVKEWTCPPLYRWIQPQNRRLNPRTLVIIVGGAPGVMSSFIYWYITELVPDLRWAHLVPMIEKGSFPPLSARKGRRRYCLQPRQDRGRELSISMDRLVHVPADCIRGKGNDPEQDLWDVKDFNTRNH